MTKMNIIGKRFCPQCGSESVDMVAGGVTGTWMCNDCGFTGMFPEKPLIESEEGNSLIQDDLDEIKESIKSKKKRSKK
jgi:transcription elongation factor Elf1